MTFQPVHTPYVGVKKPARAVEMAGGAGVVAARERQPCGHEWQR